MTAPTVAEIAGKLTKAQREALLHDGWWWRHSRGLNGSGPALLALTRKGLCERKASRAITPLGLAVRAHLQEQAR